MLIISCILSEALLILSFSLLISVLSVKRAGQEEISPACLHVQRGVSLVSLCTCKASFVIQK